VNPINRMLLARGIGPAPQHLLSIAGRVTGKMRTTPVAVVTIDGRRYVVAGFDGADWVRNARVARLAHLRRGRRLESVTLHEVEVEDSGPILREFARQVRGGQRFLTEGASHPVFRVEASTETG
jgi:hypothetical protein